jgi:hypothetical protein
MLIITLLKKIGHIVIPSYELALSENKITLLHKLFHSVENLSMLINEQTYGKLMKKNVDVVL